MTMMMTRARSFESLNTGARLGCLPILRPFICYCRHFVIYPLRACLDPHSLKQLHFSPSR